MRFARLFCLLCTAAVLAGCATSYTVDAQVQSFSGLSAVPEQPTYRYERLPSQLADPAQAELEAWAEPALRQAGWRRDDAQPRYSVQVGARGQRVLSPDANPWDPWGWGWGLGGRGWGMGFTRPFPRLESNWYLREASIIVRDLASHRVVYETRAAHEGPWYDNRAVLSALFQAALQGFPAPPAGARRVDVQIPR